MMTHSPRGWAQHGRSSFKRLGVDVSAGNSDTYPPRISKKNKDFCLTLRIG